MMIWSPFLFISDPFYANFVTNLLIILLVILLAIVLVACFVCCGCCRNRCTIFDRFTNRSKMKLTNCRNGHGTSVESDAYDGKSPELNNCRKSKLKHNLNPPPDLWIHHDQMELKNCDKNSEYGTITTTVSGGGGGGNGTLPRSTSSTLATGTATTPNIGAGDKRSYLPGFNFDDAPVLLDTHQSYQPQQPQPHLNRSTNQYGRLNDHSVVMSSNRHLYTAGNSPIDSEEQSLLLATTTTTTATTAIKPAISASKKTAPFRSFSAIAQQQQQQQQHPPQFHVPKSIVGTQVTIRTQTSPYKKSAICSRYLTSSSLSSSLTSSLSTTTAGSSASSSSGVLVATAASNRRHFINGSGSNALSGDELQRLRPSTSTEELNQEMANLEGLMKDLNAITASEFQC